jgi:hypothetical protein
MTKMRDESGRFLPGNPGGPGRPRRAVELDYLATMTEAVPPDRWRAIVERAAALAEEGDARARDWLSRYLLPKPTATAADEPDEPAVPQKIIFEWDPPKIDDSLE